METIEQAFPGRNSSQQTAPNHFCDWHSDHFSFQIQEVSRSLVPEYVLVPEYDGLRPWNAICLFG